MKELRLIGVSNFVTMYKMNYTVRSHIEKNLFSDETKEKLDEIRATPEYSQLLKDYKIVTEEEYLVFVRAIHGKYASLIQASRAMGKSDTFFSVKINRNNLRWKELKEYKETLGV